MYVYMYMYASTEEQLSWGLFCGLQAVSSMFATCMKHRHGNLHVHVLYSCGTVWGFQRIFCVDSSESAHSSMFATIILTHAWESDACSCESAFHKSKQTTRSTPHQCVCESLQFPMRHSVALCQWRASLKESVRISRLLRTMGCQRDCRADVRLCRH